MNLQQMMDRATYNAMATIPNLPLHLTPPLRTVCVEPTNDCNIHCKMCPVRERKIGYMSLSLYRKILLETSRLKPDNLYLSFQGESFLHPQIKEFLQLGYNSGIKNRVLFTNGMLIEPYLKVIAGCLTKITFSLEGPEEINDKIRVGCKYDTVLDNIEKLILARRELGSNLKIGVNITRTTQTPEEISNFKNEMLQIVDTVSVTECHDKNNRYIRRCNRKRMARYCAFPLNSIAVLWDGSVSFCLLAATKVPTLNGVRAQDWNLAELWTSRGWKLLRNESLKQGHPTFPGCSWCERWRENRIKTWVKK